MGITTNRSRPWSADEMRQLKTLYRRETQQSIADKLGRSLRSIEYQARELGLMIPQVRPWSPQQIALLKELLPENTRRDIARELGRSVWAITAKVQKLGLSTKQRTWSKQELTLLKRLYPSRTAEQIGKQLGRPVPATRLRIVKLGLKKRPRYEERHRVVKGVREKLCAKCRRWKRETDYYRRKSSEDGLMGRCQECLYTPATESPK